VTGTPLSRGLEDLYGLFYFLHARPWADALWWREGLQRPFEQGCPAGAALVNRGKYAACAHPHAYTLHVNFCMDAVDTCHGVQESLDVHTPMKQPSQYPSLR
jgi:hypothetical protein